MLLDLASYFVGCDLYFLIQRVFCLYPHCLLLIGDQLVNGSIEAIVVHIASVTTPKKHLYDASISIKFFVLPNEDFAGRTNMTCFLPSERATPVLVPATVHYSRNFHAPIFKRVTVVNTISVVFLPPPLKITSKP